MRGDDFFRQLAAQPPFSRLHPRIASFFKGYLAGEKAVPFGDVHVINSHFPPIPSRAFDTFVDQFFDVGKAESRRRLFSVTLAVTNRCGFHCWHCYNAGREQRDLPLPAMRNLAGELQDLGAVLVTLTGGEPLLRDDLEEIAGAFDDRTCLILGTTGDGLTKERARALRGRGVFGVGISLDSVDAAEHDRLRGREGAYRTAHDALAVARDAGLYPYFVSVATSEFLERGRFMAFLRHAADAGAREVHLLEPSATGRLAGRRDVLLTKEERGLIVDYQREVAGRDDLPVLSCFTYLEGEEAFGCGAGLTHLYVDGTGEVCPCNLVPTSFGNIEREPLRGILDRMGEIFRRPRPGCVGQILAGHIPDGPLPLSADASCELCARCLPREHRLPGFFRAREEAEAAGGVGAGELREAYDKIHGDYETFWLSEAAGPVDELVRRVNPKPGWRIFEAGCGTGHGTARIAARLGPSPDYDAVDLSEGMLQEARRRMADAGLPGVRFAAADALEALRSGGSYDLIFTSWVLGYIPLRPFFEAAAQALAPEGRLTFVVHRLDSPREPVEIFARLVAEDPSVLLRSVDFDFPRDAEHAREELQAAGLVPQEIWEGAITFRYDSPGAVLEHLLKSGAGTAFHDALDPARRDALERRFLEALSGRTSYPVTHDYVSCIARKA